jgi:hypothetical protein
MLFSAFSIKVLAGFLYGIIFHQPKYYAIADTYRFFNYSLAETDWLLQNPWAFFKDIFSHGYQEAGNVFIGKDSYWNDLKSNLIIKLLAVCNVVTGKNYYANVVCFNFLFFFGIIAFYRFIQAVTTAPKLLVLFTITCLPSFLFWGSGLHKDGLVFSALAMALWLLYSFTKHGFTISKSLLLLLCLLGLFAMRNYLCLLLLPTILSLFLSEKGNIKYTPFWVVYGFCFIALVAASFLPTNLNPLAYLSSKQAEFMQLSGGSKIQVAALQPSLSGFMHYLPTALDVAFIRPHPNEATSITFWPSILENGLLLLLLLTFGFTFWKKSLAPAFLACLLFSLSAMLVIGYTVTFSGAVVRYKSVLTPILILPILTCLLQNRGNERIKH